VVTIKHHLDLEVFATSVECEEGRTKLLAMFTLDAAGNLGMCTIPYLMNMTPSESPVALSI
jgi:hypothetical protein